MGSPRPRLIHLPKELSAGYANMAMRACLMSASLVATPSSAVISCLQEVCSQTAHALAAPMTQAIALTAPAALGLFCASSHEPFHANGGQQPGSSPWR